MDSKDWHIMPPNDFREHEPYVTCWCKPVEHDEQPGIWLHNAMDRRDEFEDGRRLS